MKYRVSVFDASKEADFVLHVCSTIIHGSIISAKNERIHSGFKSASPDVLLLLLCTVDIIYN